ncbi:hypothetical protein GCM10009119_14980 [Algoriphagus jejuensis]|uniref:Integrase catalytic domain-containing protein n=1 Tax=Algoriphagus jejuensis TaxID=419934 RepID=A0ABP3YAX2_9BACT
MLNILDNYNREMLAMEVDFSLPAQRVIRVLEFLELVRGLPKMIRVDNGPEFISRLLSHWCREKNIEMVFIQPGKPMQNGYVERCNGSVRKELLSANVFNSLDEVRKKRWNRWKIMNRERPHEALGYRTPVDLLKELK